MTRKNHPEIHALLKTLKLNRLDVVLDDELARAAKDNTPTAQLLQRLLALEADTQTERRAERRIRESRLPVRKILDDFDFDFQTGLDKKQIIDLASLDFAGRQQGLILAGKSGTGKSHIAMALMLIACRKNFRCRYVTAANMVRELLAGLADNTLDQKLKRFLAPEILLIDEVGFDRLEQHDAANACLFHKVIDGRYCKGSTIITSNIDFKQLGDYLGDPVITTATVDRMIHHSIIITIGGAILAHAPISSTQFQVVLRSQHSPYTARGPWFFRTTVPLRYLMGTSTTLPSIDQIGAAHPLRQIQQLRVGQLKFV